MPDVPEKKSDDGQRIWEARKAGLAQVFGQPSNMELHAVVPFFLGGFADVLAFPEYVPGVTYVTAEMTGEDTGQRPTAIGNYELMICARQELPKAGDLISKLARYTS